MPVRSLLIHAVLRLYPRRWRDRYGDEVIVLMDEAGGGIGDMVDLALGGLRQRGRQLGGGDTMSAGTKKWMTVVGGLLAILVAMPTAIFIGLSLAYPGVELKGVRVAARHPGGTGPRLAHPGAARAGAALRGRAGRANRRSARQLRGAGRQRPCSPGAAAVAPGDRSLRRAAGSGDRVRGQREPA